MGQDQFAPDRGALNPLISVFTGWRTAACAGDTSGGDDERGRRQVGSSGRAAGFASMAKQRAGIFTVHQEFLLWYDAGNKEGIGGSEHDIAFSSG
jgi:hypothetical protein